MLCTFSTLDYVVGLGYQFLSARLSTRLVATPFLDILQSYLKRSVCYFSFPVSIACVVTTTVKVALPIESLFFRLAITNTTFMGLLEVVVF